MGTFLTVESTLRELLRRYLAGEGAPAPLVAAAASEAASLPAIPSTVSVTAGLSFACFKRVWIVMRFGEVHHFCPTYLRSRDYTCAILATALAMLSHSDALWWRVGLVHALHALHATQPREDAKVPIRVSLVSAQRLSALVDALRAEDASDATRDGLAAIRAMHSSGALCFAAFEGPFLRADCDKFVHRAGSVQPEDWWCPSEEQSFASQLWPNDPDDPARAQQRTFDANAAAREADRAAGRGIERSVVLADAERARARGGGRRASAEELVRRAVARKSGALLIGVVQLSALTAAESAYSAALVASSAAKERNVACRPGSFARAMRTRLEHIGAYGGVGETAERRRAADGAAASNGEGADEGAARAAQRGDSRVAGAAAARAPVASAASGRARRHTSSGHAKTRAVSRRRAQYEEAPDESSSESESESESDRASVAGAHASAASLAAKRLPVVAARRKGSTAAVAAAGTDAIESRYVIATTVMITFRASPSHHLTCSP